MWHWSIVIWLLIVLMLSFFFTMIVDIVFRFLGKRGYLGNLFPNVRGGIPRAVGIVPFVLLSFWLPPIFNNLVLIIGIFALIDDIVGRKKILNLNIEWGQFSRGIGILLVMIAGFYSDIGLSSILIALMVQPVNISDMQPGSTCMVTMIMSVIVIILMLIVGTLPIADLPAVYTPFLILVIVLGYCPLDFAGKIMLGEVGNHSFAVALGIAFYMIGGFFWTLALFIVTTFLTAFIRRSTLKAFFIKKLKISNPTFGDYFMDVLTGGGLGDLVRRLVLKNKQYEVTKDVFIILGFRRLLYNPYAPNNKQYSSNQKSFKSKL